MINNGDKIQSMLNNIIEMATIIQNDLNSKGQTHKDYIYEKLSRAKWDLDILVEISEEKEGNKDEL